jgi:hypothetical protein
VSDAARERQQNQSLSCCLSRRVQRLSYKRVWTDEDADGDDRNPLDDADHAYEAQAARDLLKLIAFALSVMLGLIIGCGIVFWIIQHIAT